MPALKNPRHERFAQNLAEGMPQGSAYTGAGYAACHPSASRLSRHPGIVARRRELQDHAAARMSVRLDDLIGKAEAAYRLAMQTEQPGAAVAAVKEMGILSGLRVVKRANALRSVQELTDEELTAIARGQTEEGAFASMPRLPPPPMEQ